MAEPEGDEWEIWNDDGFVCKRRRRRSKINLPADHIATEDQLKKIKKRKMMILMKLRDEYKREIQEWEKLSNILSAINQETTQIQKSSSVMDSDLPKSQKFSDDFVCQNLFIDEILLQVEAQEAIILNLSNLCNAAEAMISSDKDQFKQCTVNIPLLGSPRSILVSLSD
ncbi:hypothetical protein MKW98_030222 [Papaver atlanticum]|uniref:Uncharacterized protein n=1 Tax=Papaver atlanticum TaxID=357466 RepID=A0AAD4XNX6_9MAGN|nr:hypothetical protein MKW98_030222 [Papaver atlanticum]